VADRFRLNYLKSAGLEKSDFSDSFPSNDCGKMMNSPAPSQPEYNLSETLSADVVLKQAKVDLKHPDPKVRILAIRYYLEKSYPSIPMSSLQEILSDKDPEVRSQGLRSLIKFRNPIVSPLFKKYIKDNDPGVRIAALRGMFHYQGKIDLNILIQFLSDDSYWVRRKIATLLGWRQIEGALPILIEMSRDENSTVRRAALFSLSTLYPDESKNHLMEAMSDSDPDLRKWAKMSLEKISARPLKREMASLSDRG
jgi:HEAT repeat protein